MIRTKSIYEPKEKQDGLRVLITRFYPGGVKRTHFDIWKKELAPSKQLLKDYKTKKKTWEEFTESFQFELKDQKESIDAIKDLKTKNKSNNITLLCYEKEGEFCHRHLLKKIIENPKFEIKIGSGGDQLRERFNWKLDEYALICHVNLKNTSIKVMIRNIQEGSNIDDFRWMIRQ